MAGKKENIKALFSNTRSRVIILFTLALVVVAIIIGVVKVSSTLSSSGTSSADLTNAPAGIQSIPGQLDPTPQYASLQQAQNLSQARQAVKSGGSAIPTIIRTQAFGDGIEAIGPQQGQGGAGFEALARADEGGGQKSLWIQSLKDSNCSKSSMDKVVNQGAVLADLKEVCSCVQLKDNGYTFADLNKICSCKDLKASGFNARQMKDAGFTTERLMTCGFDACELRGAGFTAQDMKDGGFSDGELKGAGYSENEINQASGLPDGITADDVRKAGCQVDALRKLRLAGVSAGAIRRISGCSAVALRAAGFSANDLKNAGFSAADLLKAGLTPADLKQAGFNARDLLNAGVSPADLLAGGYSAGDIKAAGSELPPGMTPDNVKAAGCSPEALKRERLAGVSAALIHQFAGCSAQSLKDAGFTDADLGNAGFTPQELAVSSPSAVVSKDSDDDIKAAGCDPKKLHELFLKGVTAKRIHDLNGCSAEALKNAGYNAEQLADAGFTPQDLLQAGFSPQDLLQAGLSPAGVIAVGRTADCSVDSLKAAHALGVSAATIKKTLGCTAKQMKDAGYTAAELKNAGFTVGELKNAGFGAAELKGAGFSAKDLKAAGFGASDLKGAGFSAKDLKAAGFSASDLKSAGFSAGELKDAGFSMPGLPAVNAPPVTPSAVVTIPPLQGQIGTATSDATQAANAKQLQDILKRQQSQMADQRFQQQIQQRASVMLSAATQSLQDWKNTATQVLITGAAPEKASSAGTLTSERSSLVGVEPLSGPGNANSAGLIKAGDVLFAVLDTSVNSDEPGPILATIVSGKLNGTKLIGSFNLPSNANKMVITFNTMSVPGAPKTTSINAYAIDPNTARTALASRANHHYLSRYGSLFAATFLEGFGNAFQSANTTITIGGSGGALQNTSITNGVGRSTLENAVIGLATLGKSWGQVAQQQFNQPTTVDLYSGTGIGVLFTQDVQSL